MAFDILSIPAMSAELERAFSQSKRTLSDDRSCLLEVIINALQCLKQWQASELVVPPAGLDLVTALAGLTEVYATDE